MQLQKRMMSVIFGLLLGTGLFAQGFDIDTNLDGDMLNELLHTYIINVSNLIPDSTTGQNVWAYTPGNHKSFFGIGVNGSLTMSDRTMINRIANNASSAFGNAKNMDMTQFPEGIPYLPAGSIDVRFGSGRFDMGITGMWITTDMLPPLQVIVGDEAYFAYRTFGADVRYAVLQEG